jgi:hypothetical protein
LSVGGNAVNAVLFKRGKELFNKGAVLSNSHAALLDAKVTFVGSTAVCAGGLESILADNTVGSFSKRLIDS